MPAKIPRARVQCTGSPLVGHKIAEKIAEKIAKHPLPVTERNSARAVHARQRAAHAAVQCRSFLRAEFDLAGEVVTRKGKDRNI